VGLFLTNQDTQEVIQIPSTSIGMNDPSKVMFVAPTYLAVGSYLMSIVTQSSGNSKILLNEPRTITFIQILTVE
jgi:hypothetical protein